MQALDWHVHTRLRQGLRMDDEARIFTGFRTQTLVLVESQEEYDLVVALQLIYGGEVSAIVIFKDSTEDIWPYFDSFSRVFTTWDPFDRNRI